MGDLNRRFLQYCIAGFGLAMVLTIVTIMVDLGARNKKDWADWKAYRPGFAEQSCWFSTSANGITIFFYLPILLALATNFGLFGYSAWMIRNSRVGDILPIILESILPEGPYKL